jgi:putative glutamine amidotransferase
MMSVQRFVRPSTREAIPMGEPEADRAPRPIIGITTSSVEISIEGEPLRVRYAPTVYDDAVLRAGGLPVHLPVLPVGRNDEFLDLVDGIILSGGGDLDPTSYGAAAAPDLFEVESARDAAEQELLRGATGGRVPVLGVCRGLQVMNVAYGGTLVQDLGPGASQHHHPQHVPDERAIHPVIIEHGSLLAEAVGDTSIEVNSTHHQAVHSVPPELRVTARSLDGVIEALELRRPDVWVVGVQWHPEAMQSSDPVQRRLFRALIEASSATR